MDTRVRLAAALAPRYELVREIGRGGMATVHLARDREADGLVAVKVLDPEAAHEIAPARFQREMRIAGSLEHPRIVRLLDSGMAQGLHYYVMPWVDGTSLRERLEKEGPLALDEVRAITHDVAEALDHAHARGVIHRDVKPGNILLSADGAHLADFGVARLFLGAEDERLTATGLSVGTATYASPEQASGEGEVDARSDVYSLGCVVYEMLAGEPPFTGPTPRAVVARHMAQKAPALQVVRADLPEAVSAAVERALAKVPADRFATAGAFARALVSGRPVSSPREARRRWIARAASVAGLAALAALGTRALVDRTTELDPTKVVVFPLAATSAVEDPSAGWDVALALGAALEHAEPLRFVDGWTWLDEEQRGDPGRVTARIARALTRERGAAYWVDGAIRPAGDSLSVVVRLHDVRGDSAIQETAVGLASRTTAPALGMAALLGLLPRLVDPERPVDLTPLTDRRPAATALFLQGERAYRQARFGEALSFYERAVAEDSLHAFAAIKGAQAADWASDFGGAAELVAVALAQEERLPEKYRALAHAMSAYGRGAADPAVEHLRTALGIDDQWPEAAAEMAEVYLHLLPEDAWDADSVAAHWLTAARTSDTTFAPPLFHLAEIALREGEVDRAAEVLERWAAFEPDTAFLERQRLSLACLRAGAGGIDWEAHVPDHARPVLLAGTSLASPTAAGSAVQRGCAEGALRAILTSDLPLDSWRAVALMGLQGLDLAHGRHDRVDSMLASALAEGLSFAHMFYAFAAVAGAPFAEQADRAEAIMRAATGDAYERVGPADVQYPWLMGLWLVRRGELERAEAVAAQLDARDRLGEGRAANVLARSLRAHILAERGENEAALTLLDGLTPSSARTPLINSLWEPLGLERLLAAELLFERGRYEEAYRRAALLDHPLPLSYLALLPRSLALRVRSAEAMGRTDLSRRARERLEALGWSHGDETRYPFARGGP